MKEKKKIWGRVVRIVLIVVLAGLVLAGRDMLTLSRDYPFTTVSFAGFSTDGKMLVVDAGRAAIQVLDTDGRLERTIPGESMDGFYNAQCVAGSLDTGLYVADIALETSDEGQLTVHERVLELTGGDTWREVAHQSSLKKTEETVNTNGSIYDLQVYDGAVWFLRKENKMLHLYRFLPGGSPQLKRSVTCNDSLSGASIDLTTGTIAVAARRGAVLICRHGEYRWTEVASDAEHLMCFDTSARAGEVYFSDLYAGRICRVTGVESGAPAYETVFQGEGPIYSLSLSNDAGTMLAGDGMSFSRIQGGEELYVESAPVSAFPFCVALWVCLAAAALLLLWEVRALPGWLVEHLRNETSVRVVIVIVSTLIVSGFVSYTLMTELYEREDEAQKHNIELFADLMADVIDTDALAGIRWERDYDTEEYNAIRESLNQMIRVSNLNDQYYYYVLYGLEENAIRYLINYEDSVICGEPVSEYGSDFYSDVFDSGERFTILNQDKSGSWIFTIIPVYNAGGDVSAALEVGLELSHQTIQRRESTINIILNVLCSTIVVLMLIMEVIFLLSFQARKREALWRVDERPDGPTLIPLRTLIFCSYMADSMQDVFIAIVCSELYRNTLPLPPGVAVALPMSVQLLMMAVFSAVGGQFAEKFGAKTVLIAGFLVELGGFLCCFALGTYTGLLVGKLFIGAGMGIVYVTCNTVAATGRTEQSVGAAFADVSAGTLSGLTIGGGMSSVFLSLGRWRVVYLAGSVVLALALALVLSSGDVRPEPSQPDETGREMTLLRFLFRPRVLGFLVLMLTPFMISLAFREYFFPLYSQEQGLSEVRIGQIYLMCGLVVLYTGPSLSAWLLRQIGASGSVVLASAALGLGMLLFVIWPNWVSVFIGILILSLVVSFAYTCQYSFFEALPECARFGEGKAMGVYSVFESVGQTIGPVIYGTVLALGYRGGITVLSGALLLLTAVFALAMGKSLRRNAAAAEV